MLYLAFIFHMHQPYYKNLLTRETELPWVRLHGIKDYLDMVQILERFPRIRQTFNVVPSLLEQIEDYNNKAVTDKFLELSGKPARELKAEDKSFLLANFFSINRETVIAFSPRYYELYFKREEKEEFSAQDYLDLQVCFNLSWIDPSFRESIPELKKILQKERFFSEEDKEIVLAKQMEILNGIIPAYRKAQANAQIEISVTPYYHPILPLLYDTNIAQEANRKVNLPKKRFRYPQDAESQIASACAFYQSRFGAAPGGMWPSEEGVSEHILDFIMASGISWIVTDEAILFKSLNKRKRDTRLLYQPHLIAKKKKELNIIFRDRNLSDLIGFSYQSMKAEEAADNFLTHLKNIDKTFKNQDILVTVAMDGENAWEYYRNDGHDFLNALYARLSEASFLETTTVSSYLKSHPVKLKIKRLAAGSWIYGEFGKWIGNPSKVRAWEWLADARKSLEEAKGELQGEKKELAWKQIYILEGSDWFWWAGEDPDGSFDRLFRMHLKNLYSLIKRDLPEYLKLS